MGKKCIQIQSVNEKGLLSMQKLLGEFDIKSNFYTYQRKNKNWNTNYLLFILRKESIYKFFKNIGFNHPVKQEKIFNMPACRNGKRARLEIACP